MTSLTITPSRRSLIHSIPGLPPEAHSGDRTYLLTSWTRDGIDAAVAKANPDAGRVLPLAMHHGEAGTAGSGDLWFSVAVVLPVSFVELNRGPRVRARYFLDRWVWTEDAEAAAEAAKLPDPDVTLRHQPEEARRSA